MPTTPDATQPDATTAPAPARPSPAAAAVDSMPDQDPRWKEPIFRSGLWVGALLLVLGLVCATCFPLSPTISFLIICSGLGILFGAFGSTAVVRYKGVVVAGVAGIAVVLLLLVEYLIRDGLVRLRIDGDVRGARLDLIGDETYPGADHGQFFEFIVIGKEIRSQRLTLIVSLPTTGTAPLAGPAPSSSATTNTRREIMFECVPEKAISAFLGSGRLLQWRFDARKEQLIGVSGGNVGAGPCKEADGPLAKFARGSSSLINTAYAQARAPTTALLRDLRSDSAIVRRDSRSQLASSGVSAIAPMMAELAREPNDYQVRLGVSVALAQFLRDHKGQRAAVSATLSEAQLGQLVAAAGDPDRTIRIYASEFLFDLGDKRVVPLAQRQFETASDDGKYNLLLVISGAVPSLSSSEKQNLSASLARWRGSVGAKTLTQIDRLAAALRAG